LISSITRSVSNAANDYGRLLWTLLYEHFPRLNALHRCHITSHQTGFCNCTVFLNTDVFKAYQNGYQHFVNIILNLFND